nr:CPBP family intramembrane glutamic endopeptidase [Halomarina oriensis]
MAGVFLAQLAGGWARIAQAGVPDLVGWFGTLVLFLVVGFYEELFVRGWLLTNVAEGFAWLGERLATAIAVFASAAVFGVLHLANPNATLASTLGITAAGVFLGWAFVRTASLALPVGVHVTWNFAQGSVFGFPVSGIGTPATVVETAVTGPELVTGGAFGPEAGLVGLGASVAGTLAVSGYVRLRGVPSLSEALAWTTVPELVARGDERPDAGADGTD